MRFVTCRLPDGMEDPAILSQDGTQVWPLSWLGLSYETLSDAIPFLTPQVRFGLQLAISGIPALPVEAVTLQSPIPCPAQDVVCLGINYMAHSDEAEKYSADAFSTQHQDAIYFSKRVSRAVPDGGFIEAHTDLVQKLDYECELAVVLGFKHICTLTVQEHDRMIGYVSQLCHAIAVSLMCANDNSSLCEYTGDSFRDLTRIARINDKMWAELFLWNKQNLISEIDQFDSALQEMRAALVADDRDKLEQMFRLSTQRRAAFDKKLPE